MGILGSVDEHGLSQHKSPNKTSVLDAKEGCLNYPGVREILYQAKNFLNDQRKIIFNCKANFFNLQNTPVSSNNQETYEPDYKGVSVTKNNSLLTKKLGGIKVISNYSFAYIEAKIEQEAHQGKKRTIDHFVCNEGLFNADILAEAIKAYDLDKDDPIVFIIPQNAIQAFRQSRFTEWQQIKTKRLNSSFLGGILHEYDKEGKVINSFNLVEYKATNLAAPVYKSKIGERWVILVPTENTETLSSDISLIVQDPLSETDFIRNATEITEIINCSVGQAARAIFNLYESNFENIPEALLYVEGGTWSSIPTEKGSDGRHTGLNNMFDVLKHKWHTKDDIAIPWNYLSMDVLNAQNLHLLGEESTYALSPDKNEYRPLSEKLTLLEVPQVWKKVSNELLSLFIKTSYSEYLSLGTRKFHLSLKELLDLAVKYLAKTLNTETVPQELIEFLQILTYVHEASSSSADFFSCKTHPSSLARLQMLAKAHKAMQKLCPAIMEKFEAKINAILVQDIKSELTILADLYCNELNKEAQ
jgi:hypothetical protein